MTTARECARVRGTLLVSRALSPTHRHDSSSIVSSVCDVVGSDPEGEAVRGEYDEEGETETEADVDALLDSIQLSLLKLRLVSEKGRFSTNF